jgi:hypothetical protein
MLRPIPLDLRRVLRRIGLGGNDSIGGGLGIDSPIGGVGDSGDVIVEIAGEGYDIVTSSVSCSLANAALVEKLALTGLAINGTGKAG